MLTTYSAWVDQIIIWYFIAINACYILLLISAIPDVLTKFKVVRLGKVHFFLESQIMPPVTILLSAYNEEAAIIDTIHSILQSTYPNIYICILNDGSTDNTLPLLFEFLQLKPVTPIIRQVIKTAALKRYYISNLYPHISVIDKVHSGKADSLNVGINACRTPLFLTIDADTIIEPTAISSLVFSLLSKPDTIAEGGSVYILNGCEYKGGQLIEEKMSTELLVAMQTCEYLRAFLFGRTGWNLFGGPLILSGALTLFDHQAVQEIGGFKLDCPGEDMEVVVQLHESMLKRDIPYRISYTFAASAWTLVPRDMNKLWSQRDRWYRGLMDSLLKHKKLFFNPRYGLVGLFSYPFHVLGELFGPIVELIGYLAVIVAMYFHILDWRFAVLFFIASWGLVTILTMATTLVSLISFNKYQRIRDVVFIMLLVVFESCGFRQFMVVCRVFAAVRYISHKLKQLFTGKKTHFLW